MKITYFEGAEIDLGVIMCCLLHKDFLSWYLYINAEACLKSEKQKPLFRMRFGDASRESFIQTEAITHIMYSACVAGPTTTLGMEYNS